MASQGNNIGTTALIILIVTILIGSLYFVSNDISDNNTKLDSKSVIVITNLGANYTNNIKGTSFAIGESEYNDSTFNSVDPFSRQYLEDKSEIDQKKSILNTVLLYPSFLISIFGVSNEIILLAFGTLLYTFIAFMLGLQIYKAIRTGEVD